jgi:chromate transporter
MTPDVLFQLIWRFVYFSLITFGAGFAIIIPQIHAHFVNQLHWLTDQQFTETVAVAQASPGPNFQMVPLIGWRAAGPLGAIVALAAFMTIPTLLAAVVGRAVRNASENPRVILMQRALRPVSCGLWFASGIGIARASEHNLTQVGITVGIGILSTVVDVNPLWWLGAAGALSILFSP